MRRYDYKPLTGGNENTPRGGWIVMNYAIFCVIILSAGVWLLFRGYNFLIIDCNKYPMIPRGNIPVNFEVILKIPIQNTNSVNFKLIVRKYESQ